MVEVTLQLGTVVHSWRSLGQPSQLIGIKGDLLHHDVWSLPSHGVLAKVHVYWEIRSMDEHFISRKEGPQLIRSHRDQIPRLRHRFILGEDSLADFAQLRRQVMNVLADQSKGDGEIPFGQQHGDGHDGQATQLGYKRCDPCDSMGRTVVGKLEQRQVRRPLVMLRHDKFPNHLTEHAVCALGGPIGLEMVRRCQCGTRPQSR